MTTVTNLVIRSVSLLISSKKKHYFNMPKVTRKSDAFEHGNRIVYYNKEIAYSFVSLSPSSTFHNYLHVP